MFYVTYSIFSFLLADRSSLEEGNTYFIQDTFEVAFL